jgi:surface antigen Omp85-like protein
VQHSARITSPFICRRRFVTAAVGLLFIAVTTAGADPARRKVVAGDYHAGGLRRFLLGSDYRATWAAPVEVEVLDLSREAGGLEPVRRVGGQQTKGLALAGADGRSYTFRGLEKDASHILDAVDPDLKDSIVGKILEDQMAAQHPGSELIARGILDAVGIPVPDWRLVVLPDDPALGEFRKDFAGAVGVFAVYPQAAKGPVPGFAGATDIIGHSELYKRLEAGQGDAADTQALLKARLVDILMGDWDRHRKQWRWAKLPGSPLWTPIPEDRDQAFSRYEGFLLGMTRGRDPRFQDFGPKYPNIGGLTYNGSEQDRRLLVGLSQEDFVRTATALQAQLTDAALEQAVRNMPPEWYAIDGPRLLADLEARRAALPEIAAEYHRHLAHRVDVYMTNQSERVEAKRLPSGDLDVTISIVGKDDTAEAPYFHHVFDGKETEEVRFYALDGNDRVVVTGGKNGPRVRMIGANGNDVLDATGAGNAKLSDSQGQNRAVNADADTGAYTPPPPPRNAPWIPPRDWTRESWGAAWVSYSADLGPFLGYGFHTERYGFRKEPYANVHQVRAGWSFDQKSFRADYTGEYHRENRGSFLGLFAYASGVEVLRFYGFGNETLAPSGNNEFNKVDANQFLLYPTFKVPFSTKGLLSFGPAAKYTQSDQGKDQFINVVRPYGVGDYGSLALAGVLSWDGRDSAVFPRKGVFAAARASYFPEIWDVTSAFSQVNGNVNTYFSAGRAVTFALRAGGKKVFGTYPYLEAASIGEGGLGPGALSEPRDTVRGYRARRYLGDGSLWGNADVRLRVSHITLVLPGSWGLQGFADIGRVWVKGESSDTWHPGVGGGIWVSLLNDRMAFSAGISHGKDQDKDLFYFRGGFSY